MAFCNLRFRTHIIPMVLLAMTSGNTLLQAQPVQPQANPTASLYTYRAIITKVYDGDTVTAEIDLGMKIWLRGERLRLWGIDRTELNRGDDRVMARKARDFLRKEVLGQKVIVKTIKDRKGKYGRYHAVIYKNNVNINELMLLQE